MLEALEPLVYTKRVSKGESWKSLLRADNLLKFGGRLVCAAGGGKVTDPNSFGSIHTEWKNFLAKADGLGGSAHADHVASAQKFVADSLALAGHHGRISMADSNPLGAIPVSFVPAGADPFEDLDTKKVARQQVVILTSALPSVAKALGVAQGLSAPGLSGVAAAPGALHPPPGVIVEELGAPPTPKPGAPPKDGITKSAKKAAKRRAEALAVQTAKGAVKAGILSYSDGSSARISDLAAAAGCGVNDLCWPVAAARGEAKLRVEHCPCRGSKDHEGPNSRMHKRPAGFWEKLGPIFGRQLPGK